MLAKNLHLVSEPCEESLNLAALVLAVRREHLGGGLEPVLTRLSLRLAPGAGRGPSRSRELCVTGLAPKGEAQTRPGTGHG